MTPERSSSSLGAAEVQERLVAFGRRLAAPPADHGLQPSAFLQQLLEMAEELPSQGATSASNDDALSTFRTLIMRRWADIEARLEEEVAIRRRALTTTQAAVLDALSDAPDLLSPLGRARDEVTHTKVLGHLLQRSALRAKLQSSLLNALDLPTDGCPGRALTEVYLDPERRIDLVLHLPDRLVFVENKVDSCDREDQLPAYRAALQERGARLGLDDKHLHLVFLTLRGKPSTKTTVPHMPLGYRKLARAWLPLLPSRAHGIRYLAAWLRTVLGPLLGCTSNGPFDHWPLHQRHRTLDLLEDLELP